MNELTETTPRPKNKGGRPPMPAHVLIIDSATCRVAITRELLGQNRVRQLQQLHKLHKAFLAGEEAARDDLKDMLLAEQVTIQRQLLEVRKDEYRRRRELGIQRRQEGLTTEGRASINSGTVPTLEESDGSVECTN